MGDGIGLTTTMRATMSSDNVQYFAVGPGPVDPRGWSGSVHIGFVPDGMYAVAKRDGRGTRLPEDRAFYRTYPDAVNAARHLNRVSEGTVSDDDSEGKHLITVRKVRDSFVAVLKGHAARGYGRTQEEAVGDCVLHAHRILGITVHVVYSGEPDPRRATAKSDPIVPDIQLARDVIAAHAVVECERAARAVVECEYAADDGVYQPGPVS